MNVAAASMTPMRSGELQQAFAVKRIALQKDAMKMAGQMTSKLMQSAFNEPGVGQHLDVRA